MAGPISIEARNVSSSGQGQQAFAGEDIAAGELLYRDPTDSRVFKATTLANDKRARVVGMAVNSAFAGQPVVFVGNSEVSVGAVFEGAGRIMVLAKTVGAMIDSDLLEANTAVTIIGWTVSRNAIQLALAPTGVLREAAGD